MKNEDLLSIIYDWQNIALTREGAQRNIERSVFETIGSKPIKIITGFRRCGKSFLLQQLIRKAVKDKKIEKDNFLYINFEDYRLENFTTNRHLESIYSCFKENSGNKKGRKIIAFDEIQKIDRWEKFIRTLYEKESDIEIFLTGSNSQLLSSELSSALSGRFIEFRLFPFSFCEYLDYKKIKCESEKEFIRHEKLIRTEFNTYLNYGGLPEVFEINTHDARLSYLSGIINKVILDDVVKRFHVENIEMLERIFRFIVAESGKQISFQNMVRYLKQTGINTKAETVIKYTGYLLKAFALSEVIKLEWSSNQYFSSQKKYYSADTGLISVVRRTTENFSFRLENVVALELMRRYTEIYYGRNRSNKEIDFLVKDGENWNKIQICQELNAVNVTRETSVFADVSGFLNGDNLMLTYNKSNLSLPGKITEKNLLKWLLKF